MPPSPDRSVSVVNLVLLGLTLARPGPAAAEPRTWRLDPEPSRVLVHVGKAGLFKFAGHEHEVEAPLASGAVVADAQDLSRATVRLEFESARLRVTGRGEPPADVPKVQETMRGPRVLDAAVFPLVRFESTRVSGREREPGVYELEIEGRLQIRDRTAVVAFPVSADTRGGRLVVTGKGRLKQSAFGITPVSVAGVVKVRDELELELRFEGTPAP